MVEKLSKELIEIIGKHIHFYSGVLQLRDWNIYFSHELKDDENTLAEVDTSHYDKTFKITFTKKIDKDNIEDTIIHELIHGKLAVMKERIEKAVDSVMYEFEEEFVNDITKGITIMKEVKDDKENSINKR